MAANIEVYDDKDALLHAAAQQFVRLAQDAVQDKGRFDVALAGGSTPKPLYALLASEAYRDQVDWSQVRVFWGDERCVPPDNEASNYHMAWQAMLNHVPIPDSHVHRMRGEMEPTTAAFAYEQVLESVFGEDLTPRFDLIHLGMGDDGHTASLFPNTPALDETEKFVVAHYVGKLDAWRITLTPRTLNHAANISFLVSGAGKAAVLQAVLNGPSRPQHYPSQLVQPVDGVLRWLVDQDAAAQLTA